SSERSKAVRFEVSAGKLEISSNSPELGEASEVLSIEYEGEDVSIGFNARYVLDFLDAVEDSRIRLTLKDAKTQGLFTPEGEHPYDYRYVVMPMQIRGGEVN
ncbi:MAG: DNA polymerase III subunit beta, partial [Acidobacteriota bacterium]